jgi:hypothetical protein
MSKPDKVYEEKCEHIFRSLGFDTFKTTETTVEAVAAIFCSKCGLFRTKILTFRREFKEDIEKSGE